MWCAMSSAYKISLTRGVQPQCATKIIKIIIRSRASKIIAARNSKVEEGLRLASTRKDEKENK